MKIVVCLKEVLDPTLNLDFGLTNRVVFREGLPLTLNPDDAAALSLALDTKNASKEVEITLVSIGPARVTSYLRNGLALGAAKALRIWDEGLGSLSPFVKARLLTAAVSLLGADLVFTGSRGLDTSNRMVGPLMAAWLDWPCVSGVLRLEPDFQQNIVTLIKDLGRGEREKLICSLPAVISVKGDGKLPYASLDRLIESQYAVIPVFSAVELGISPAVLHQDPAPVADLVFPRPAPRKAPLLDSSLPAFYRILQLLEGGIAKRKGVMLEGSGPGLAERLFQLLKDEGVLKPAVD